jgi:hypothetical protein
VRAFTLVLKDFENFASFFGQLAKLSDQLLAFHSISFLAAYMHTKMCARQSFAHKNVRETAAAA